jgi:dihydrofolate reductase
VRRTQYYTATSIDGFIADERHSLDWLHAVDAGGDGSGFPSFFSKVGAMAMGASTYSWLLAHDDFRTDPAAAWRRAHGDTPCWVFTHRDLPRIPGAPIRLVQGDVAPVHAAMAEAAGARNIWIVGGGELAGQFADRGLLDEIVATVAPVTLGAGAPLLPRRLESSQLELVDVRQAGQLAQLTYALRR